MEPVLNHKIEQVQCVIVPGQSKYCPRDFWPHYDAAYECWHSTVQEGLRSLQFYERAQTLTSDDFVRHDEVICLFAEGVAVGISPLAWQRLSPANLDHSYFRYYPATVIKRLREENIELLLTTGVICVRPEWRKSKAGLGISELLMSLIIKRYLQSPADLLLFFTRNSHRVNELGYRHGGTCWAKDFASYGSTSDAIVFYRDQARISPELQISILLEKLWNNKKLAFKPLNSWCEKKRNA